MTIPSGWSNTTTEALSARRAPGIPRLALAGLPGLLNRKFGRGIGSEPVVGNR